MSDVNFHPKRKTLVEHVSDDIRSLHASSVQQQKTLLSGRALADVLKGDSFSISRATDQKYFEHVATEAGVDYSLVKNWGSMTLKTNAKVDFSRVTEACIRHFDQGGFVNGPEAVATSGFLHVLSVLPSGSLTYNNGVAAERSGDKISIRQIIYPDDMQDLEAYTRVGKYITVKDPSDPSITLGHMWEWSGWQPMSSRTVRILVNQEEAQSIVGGTLRNNVIYELHCGGISITLPNADACNLASSIVFEQYSNQEPEYTRVDTSTTITPAEGVRYFEKRSYVSSGGVPYTKIVPAGGTGSQNGWITSFVAGVEYYTASDPLAWMNVVNYTEKVYKEDGQTTEDRTYTTTLAPALDTARTSETAVNAGDWYVNSEAAVQYRFEVIDRGDPVTVDGVDSTQTWMLDVDAEAVTRMSDMAELLDAHTDPMLEDIIQYSRRQFRGSLLTNGSEGSDGNVPSVNANYREFVPYNNKPLIVSRNASMNGVVRFKIDLDTSKGGKAALSNDFCITFYKYNEYATGFNRATMFDWTVVDTSVAPNMYKKYWFLNEDGVYTIAGQQGYITSFDSGKTYYTREVKYAQALDPVKFKAYIKGHVDGAGTPYGYSEYDAKFLAVGTDAFDRNGPFFGGTNNKTSIEGFFKVARNDTVMVVIESTNHNKNRSSSSDPYGDQEIVSPILEFYPDPHGSYPIKPEINKTAFTDKQIERLAKPGDATDMIAGSDLVIAAYKMLAENLQKKGLLFGAVKAAISLNDIVGTGIYTVNGSTEGLPSTDQGGTASHSPVAGGTNSNASLIVIDSVARDYDNILDNSDDYPNPDRSDTSFKRVTQVLIGNCVSTGSNQSSVSIPKIWVRYGTIKSGTTSWTNWVSFQTSQIVREFAGDVTRENISEELAKGSPVIVVKGSSTTTRDVELPDPKYYKNAKLQVEAVGCKVTIHYSDKSYSGTTTKTSPSRMLYPIECDGVNWYIITVS